MANDLNQRPAERNLSDVVGVQQGVEDRSAATKAQGQVTVFSSVGNMVGQVAEQKAASSNKAAEEAYFEDLKTEANMISQGSSQQSINLFRNQADKKAADRLSVADRIKLRNQFENLAIGEPLTQKTVEQRQEEQLRDMLVTMNLPDTEDNRKKATKLITDLANAEGNAVTQGTVLISQVLPGKLEEMGNLPSENERLGSLAALKAQTYADGREIAKGNAEAFNIFKSMVDPMFEAQERLFKSVTQAEQAKARNDIAQEADKAYVYSQLTDRERVALATSNLGGQAFQQAMVIELDETLRGLGKRLINMSDDEINLQRRFYAAKAVDTGVYNPTTDEGQDALKAGAGILKSDSAPKEVKDRVTNDALNNINTYLQDVDLTDTRASMEALAGDLGAYVRENEVDSPTRKKLAGTLQKMTASSVIPAVQDVVAKTFRVTDSRGNPIEGGITRGEVELQVVGDNVMFVSKGASTKEVSMLNRRLQSDLTTWAKALSNVYGSTLEQSIETITGEINAVFPEKSETTPTSEAVAPVPQEGVAQGIPASPDEDVVLERDLGERDMAILERIEGTEYEDKYKTLTTQIDTVEDPSLRYVLKKNLKDLIIDATAGTSTGGRSGKARKQQEVPLNDMPPAEKATSGGSFETRAKLRAQAGIASSVAPEGEVDWDFLQEQEGFETEAYVPQSNGKVLGTSGATIGMGIDLGVWGDKLEELGVNQATAKKLEKYSGKKGETAKQFLEDNPIRLSEEEAKEVSTAVKSKLLEEIKTKFNKESKVPFDSLTREQRTIITSVFFQYGMNKRKGWPTNFWDQVTSGDWEAAKKNLRNFGDNYGSRRNREADYLG